MNIHNATQLPRIFYCRHMQPGVVRYEDEDILVDTQGMKNLIASMKNDKSMPVYIHHQDVDLKNLKQQADGFVCDSFYNELDGWAWFKFIAVDDKAHEAIKKGWKVSNCYTVTLWGTGGTKNNVAYKREMLNGEFTHLAIVPDPRYEQADIMTADEYKNYNEKLRDQMNELRNSKSTNPQEKTAMFKFFKNERKEVSGAEVDMDSMVELSNGKSVSMKELVDNFAAVEDEKAQSIEINGKKVTVEELVNAMEKKNKKKMKNGESKAKTADQEDHGEDAEGDQDDEGDDEIGADKKNKKMKKNKKKNSDDDADEEDCMNSDDEDDKDDKKNKKMKKNSKSEEMQEVEMDDKYFEQLRNAHTKPVQAATAPLMRVGSDGLKRGQERYGLNNNR